MEEKNPLKTTVEYEAYNHRILWSSFIKLLDQIKVTEKEKYDIEIPAKIMAAFAMEALFNWIGDHFYTEYWKDEKKKFKSKEYPGVLGKYIWLHEKLLGSKPNLEERPHRALSEIIAFRHLCAHARKDVNQEEFEGEYYGFISGKIYVENKRLKIEECKSDIETVARILYEKLDKREIRFLGPDPLLGIREINSGTTRAV